MNFTVINEAFQCGNCGAQNKPHTAGSCRNHCTECLYSKHLDKKNPGDRASKCHALMKPIGLDYNGKKGWILIHQCNKCGHQMRNKTAEDDKQDAIIELSQQTR